ncbi:MAG: FHA domain-containing protein [Acidimicrobiia bacterium]
MLWQPSGDDTTVVFSGLEERADLEESIAVSLDELAAGAAILVVLRGPNAGSRYRIDAEVTMAGRHPDSDIFLDDVTVSRRHAEIIRGPQGFRVRDTGSLNGTYVNRDRVEEASLSDGDELQIGRFRLAFYAGRR